ncbi:MAG: glycerate kinase type-2 family protein [Myxococcales bacterium]|jgi:glycerate 2-kinase
MPPPDLDFIYRKSVAALSGENLVRDALAARDEAWANRIRVIALGKAGCSMARGAARALAQATGVVASHVSEPVPPGFELVVGSHPVPDERSVHAARALREAARGAREDEQVLFLISGGGSAIAALPTDGVTLAEKIETTRALLRSGAAIEEMNAVRKHLSAIKGGQLGAACRSRRSQALVLSDVSSNDLGSVASGPTVADTSTFGDCLEIARSRQIALPRSVLDRLERGAAGELPETPKPGDPRLEAIEHRLLAGPRDLAETAARLAASEQVRAEAHGPFSGSVEQLAEDIHQRAASAAGRLLLAYCGEPTLRVPAGSGKGGRMQHLALLLARRFAGQRFQALCAGSDGRDGDTDHGGALVDGQTAARAVELGVDLDSAIARFDSATALGKLAAALPAFASGTNLCDLVLFYLEA